MLTVTNFDNANIFTCGAESIGKSNQKGKVEILLSETFNSNGLH